MSFHSFRDGNFDKKNMNMYNKLWLWHDKHPLPYKMNICIRKIILYFRAYKMILKRKFFIERKLKHKKVDEFGDPIVPDRRIVNQKYQFSKIKKEKIIEWFEKIHNINEFLRNKDGSWNPQPYANYSGKGISIEEVALRIIGYYSAFKATNNTVYLNKAREGVRYLLEKRFFADGHLLLQGHTVIDTTYTFAGLALLKAYEMEKDEKFLKFAEKLGEHLISYQIAGSTNHAAIPAQLLAKLYFYTGQKKFLKYALKRIKWAVLPFQLPYGGWYAKHESWSWYHSIIAQSILETYIYTPFTLEFIKIKDNMAIALYKAINRLILAQREDGSIKAGRGALSYDEKDEYGSCPSNQWVYFDEKKKSFTLLPPQNKHEFYSFELYFLCNAWYRLPLPQLGNTIYGLSNYYMNMNRFWRLEFDTLAVGMLLEAIYEIGEI